MNPNTKENALQALNHCFVCTSSWRKERKKKQEELRMMTKEGHTNVFVKFLPPTVDDVELSSLFSKFGTIVSCKVMINQVTGVSLGYG